MAKKRSPLEKVDNFDRRKSKYGSIAAALTEVYGELDWARNQDGMDELVSCILSQSTNDTNRDRAFERLKSSYESWHAVRFAEIGELTDVIRPAGLANQKAPRIQDVLATIHDKAGEYSIDFLDELSIEEAKDWLVSLKGIGPKTAAIVLCFAYGRPAFPVDTHIYRVSKRIGFIPEKLSANDAHPVMEAIVPADDYYQFHIQLIQHGRDTCHARKPACERCSITRHCDYFVGDAPPQPSS
ncbi:MAG: endonuclease III [Chloroflexota bacterium]|nr:endonuclease III [Chloroflexota bacterium]